MVPRLRTEEREQTFLSPFAAKSAQSAGRPRHEEQDPIRTCFQRDRDRILHSKAFRRLMHKTQVFISPEGDHYRTRLTHTLEVAQISRTVARALSLNEDLAEAIAIGHDVGHPPFGHAGEFALDEAIHERDPEKHFRHYEQSVRVLTVIENLNLTRETLDGIGSHSKGRSDLVSSQTPPECSLEAMAVRISDRIAYLNHDIDDALRAEWFRGAPKEVEELGKTHSERIGTMVGDLIDFSTDKPYVSFGPQMSDLANRLKEFLFDNFYLEYARRFPDIEKAQNLVKALFKHFADNTSDLPQGFSGVQGAIDYVSGMTDRFAISTYERLFVPADWPKA